MVTGPEPYCLGSQTSTDRNSMARLQFSTAWRWTLDPVFSWNQMELVKMSSTERRGLLSGDPVPWYPGMAWHGMAAPRHELLSCCRNSCEARRRRITPSPLDNGAANAGTAWFQGRNIHSGPVDFLESFFTTLVGQEKSEFQYLGWLPP